MHYAVGPYSLMSACDVVLTQQNGAASAEYVDRLTPVEAEHAASNTRVNSSTPYLLNITSCLDCLVLRLYCVYL